MKETIYTIPVNDAFATDCECPICLLEKDLEEKTLSFILGPSSMEPDTRVATNEIGFCRRHMKQLYLKRQNVLGLSLVLDTHLQHQMDLYQEIVKKHIKDVKKTTKINSGKMIDDLSDFFLSLESSCEVCNKMNSTMERYFDVFYWMYDKDPSFRKKVVESKGFCLRHYQQLLQFAKNNLSRKKLTTFTLEMNTLMSHNMERILNDVQWFAQKFDHRNEKASWKTSEDAVPRTIEKFISYCDFK
ncbi:MAG: ABC transporter substrate-binding protein [Clostridiales bacterium]|nr:ABC transporter substrate-binding protein [Clostridiales bacterium]